MRKNRSGAAQFFISFLLGIFILALPFSYALFKFAGDKLPAASEAESYYPQSSDSIVLIAALKKTAREPPHSFVLCGIDPLSDKITLAVIPPEIMAEDAGSFDSAANIWRREGAARGSAALQGALGVLTDRWLELDQNSIVELGNVAGATDFTPAEPISLEGGLIVLPDERQLIDGSRAALLISYDGYEAGADMRFDTIGVLCAEMLRQRLPLMTEALLVKLFETAVNSGSSDLTIGDFESRRRALVHMLSRAITVEVIAVHGSYNEGKNTFLPSAQTLSELSAAF